jgi:hypothetical protein
MLKNMILLFFVSFAVFLTPLTAQTLPPKFDPRDPAPNGLGKTPPTSNQGATSNCWIHSAVATAELNYMKTFPGNTPLKFSETYYNFLRTPYNGRASGYRPGFTGGFFDANNYNPYAISGHALDMAASSMYGIWSVMNYMVNWFGPILDSELSYSVNTPKTITDFENYKPQVHVQGYEVIPVAGAVGGPANHNDRIRLLKEAIFNNGAFALGFGGHSMSFVGWDDNKDGGSFLQKESYGNGSGLYSEYKWHSYSTTGFGTQPAVSVSHTEAADNYKQNYFHTVVLGTARRITGHNSVTLANVFTAKTANERLDAVGFSTVHSNTAYEIYVNPSGDALNATSLVKVGGGTAAKPGYRTVKIDQKTLGSAGSKFAVAVKYTLPSGVTTFDFDSQDMMAQQLATGNFTGVHAGQSFVNTTGGLGGTWADLATGSGYPGAIGGPGRTGNVPIRAYTGGGTVQPTAPTITTTALTNGVNGKAYSQNLYATGTAPITWSITSGTLPAGLTLNNGVISGTPTAVGSSTFTVRATNSVGNSSRALSITINNPVITVTSSPGGKVMQNGEAINSGTLLSVTSGSNQTFTFVEDNGFEISDVKINGTSNSGAKTSKSYTFSNVRDDARIDVTFVPTGGGDTDCSGYKTFAESTEQE